jgi:hypothetical protein
VSEEGEEARRRRAEADRLAPVLLAGMRFQRPDQVRERGQRADGWFACEGGCGTRLVVGFPQRFLCSECLTWGLEQERRLGLVEGR